MKTLKGLLAATLALSSFLSFTPTASLKAADFLTDESLQDYSTAEPEAWGVTPDAIQYKYQ